MSTTNTIATPQEPANQTTASGENNLAARLTEDQKTWIRDVVKRNGPDSAAGMYCDDCAVDQYGRSCIKDIFGVEVGPKTRTTRLKPAARKKPSSTVKKPRKKKAKANPAAEAPLSLDSSIPENIAA